MKKNNLYLLDELKELYSIDSYKALAERFDIPLKTINTWVNNGQIAEKGLSVPYLQLLIDTAKKEIVFKKRLQEMQEALGV